MKNKIIQVFLILIIIFIPFAMISQSTSAFAADDYNSTVSKYISSTNLDYSGFVNCDGVTKSADTEPRRQNTCDFGDLIGLVIKLMNWLFIISIPVATVLFAYGGLLYIKGPKEKEQAKKIFTAVVIGFIIMLVAWFSVRTIVGLLVESNSGATTFVQ